MFDVFYSGTAPGLFAHEQQAQDLEHARSLCSTRYFWWVNYLTDYTGWDFLWEPVPWQADQTHVWASQHQQHGGTCLVPRRPSTQTNYHTDILPRTGTVPCVGIDHGSGLTVSCAWSTRFVHSYLGTLRRILARVDAEHVWVVSSVCDYADFDFSWHPSQWQQDMLHVWASDAQQFGDTFYVHVPSFLQKSQDIELLEWYQTLCFHADQPVPRKPVTQVKYHSDSLVPAVKQHEFQDPLIVFTNKDQIISDIPAVNLWREQTRTVTPLTPGAGTCIVPRDAKTHLHTQLYDYAGLDRNYENSLQELPLDVVFIENGEATAELCWQHLQRSVAGHINRIHRIAGVNGRDQAYRAAAEASGTAWFFAVFAKLEMVQDFDWSWQPDRLQEAKHYIFYARNPINGLEYGHQAMIAYNKTLVLANTGQGLDFTLNDPHAVVPIISGTAHYAATPWMAWRTAFRETIKLKHSLPDVENEYRLKQWLEKDITPGRWSQRGAQDAVEFYDQVQGDFAELRKSYEWEWLHSYFFFKHNQSTDQ